MFILLDNQRIRIGHHFTSFTDFNHALIRPTVNVHVLVLSHAYAM